MELTLNKIAKDTETDLIAMNENHFEFFAIPDGRIVRLGLEIDKFLKFLAKANMIKEYSVVIKRADDAEDDYDVLQCEYVATKYDQKGDDQQ